MRSLLSTLIQFGVLMRRQILGHRRSDLGMCAQGKDHERTLPGAFIFDHKKISFKCLSPQTLVTRHRSPNIPKPCTAFLTTVIKCLTRTLKGGRWLHGSVAPWQWELGAGSAHLITSWLTKKQPVRSEAGLSYHSAGSSLCLCSSS